MNYPQTSQQEAQDRVVMKRTLRKAGLVIPEDIKYNTIELQRMINMHDCEVIYEYF